MTEGLKVALSVMLISWTGLAIGAVSLGARAGDWAKVLAVVSLLLFASSFVYGGLALIWGF